MHQKWPTDDRSGRIEPNSETDGEGFDESPLSTDCEKDLRKTQNQGASLGASFLSEFTQNVAPDTDLAAVIEAWPNLLASTKRRIVELATATVQQE
jgi:hypothetical protein